jgi:hypothetical protein
MKQPNGTWHLIFYGSFFAPTCGPEQFSFARKVTIAESPWMVT